MPHVVQSSVLYLEVSYALQVEKQSEFVKHNSGHHQKSRNETKQQPEYMNKKHILSERDRVKTLVFLMGLTGGKVTGSHCLMW